jgi:hypothetical protein
MKSCYIEKDGLTVEKWKTIAKEYDDMSAITFYGSKMGSTGVIKSAKEYYSRTKFRFKDNTELVLDIENNYIEVEGLRISTEVLTAVTQKINEEKRQEEYDKIPF